MDTAILQQQQISFRLNDALDVAFAHTNHSYLRSAQRGIDQHKLAVALAYGESIFKQGLIYYILGEDQIPEKYSRERKRLKNTVVVVAGDSDKVVTCYRSNDPFRNIRTKSKKLNK